MGRYSKLVSYCSHGSFTICFYPVFLYYFYQFGRIFFNLEATIFIVILPTPEGASDLLTSSFFEYFRCEYFIKSRGVTLFFSGIVFKSNICTINSNTAVLSMLKVILRE